MSNWANNSSDFSISQFLQDLQKYNSSNLYHQTLSLCKSKKHCPVKWELSGMQTVRSIISFHVHSWIPDIYCILLVEPAHSKSPVSMNLCLQLDIIKRDKWKA